MSYAADPELGKLLGNVDFRHALALGIDRDAVNEVLFLGLGTPGSIAPAEGSAFSPGPDSEWRTKWSTHDVKQANALLDGLGLTERNAEGVRLMANGQPLRIELMTYLSFMDFTALGEMMAEDYRDLGIQLNVVEMERTATQTRRRNNEHQLTIDVTWGAENIFGHPTELWPNTALGCAGPEFGKYIATQGKEGTAPPKVIAEVEELYQLATQAPPEKRLEMGKEIWRIILENQWAIGTVGLSPAIQGVRVVNKKLGNVPARQLNDANVENPGNSRPEQFYFKS
jgi:peptide/nickel transport system substrate-binding protein